MEWIPIEGLKLKEGNKVDLLGIVDYNSTEIRFNDCWLEDDQWYCLHDSEIINLESTFGFVPSHFAIVKENKK